MDIQTIQNHLGRTLEETHLEGLGERKQGKVRDWYTQKERVIFVATDRYSAFDRNLALIPFKGQVLTGIALFWFNETKDIIANHVLGSPDPNVIIGKPCTVLPIEVVVRGYITGVTSTSLWTHYQAGERDFGDFQLPDGLTKNQKLASPVITPTTKFEAHDRPLTGGQVVSEGFVEQSIWKRLQEAALALFARGQEKALERGLILVDTKYEFGLDVEGKLTLIDEVFTPDSSRYWQAASYEERIEKEEEPEYFDKEFLRLWFKDHCDPYKDEKIPSAPEDMVVELSSRYIRIYEQLTGKEFVADETPVIERITKNLESYRIA